MLIRFGSWLINPEEIEAVMTVSPYILRVQMTSGKVYDLSCKNTTEQVKEREKILRAVELYFPHPINRDELDTVVQEATGKIRDDIRALKKLVLAEMEGLRDGQK